MVHIVTGKYKILKHIRSNIIQPEKPYKPDNIVMRRESVDLRLGSHGTSEIWILEGCVNSTRSKFDKHNRMTNILCNHRIHCLVAA